MNRSNLPDKNFMIVIVTALVMVLYAIAIMQSCTPKEEPVDKSLWNKNYSREEILYSKSPSPYKDTVPAIVIYMKKDSL